MFWTWFDMAGKFIKTSVPMTCSLTVVLVSTIARVSVDLRNGGNDEER